MKALLLSLGAVRPSRSKFVTSNHSAFGRWPAGAPHLSIKSAPLRSLALLSVLCGFAASADAKPPGVGGGFRHLPPPPLATGPFIGFPGVYVVERETVHVVEREVVKEVPAPAPEPPPPPRKPYVLGASYDTLPTGCMKMIQDGASYYLCSGEWYRQLGSDSGVSYKAVKAP